MWRSRSDRDGTTVVCIACGTSLPRSEAREYDKHGNRWERHGKSFEHLCKECYRGLCHQPRGELEALLLDVEAEVRTDFPSERSTVADTDADSGLDSDTDADSVDDTDVDSDADSASVRGSRAAFLSAYARAVEARYGSIEPSETESERDR